MPVLKLLLGLLGTHMANSAGHPSGLDRVHVASSLRRFLDAIEVSQRDASLGRPRVNTDYLPSHTRFHA